jgi:tetratricopeptide (TPR) repeat protein
MCRIGLALMLSVWMLAGAAFAADDTGGGKDSGGAGGGQGAGWFPGGAKAAPADAPAAAPADATALADLAKAQELMAQEGNESQALVAALKLITVFESAKDNEHLAECLTLVGEGYYYTGGWANAQKYMQRAWDVGFKTFGDGMSTFPLKVIGESQFEQKQYDQALVTFQQRADIERQRADVEELPGALYDTASALSELGRSPEALKMLEEAAAANEKRAQELSAQGASAKPDELEAVGVDSAEIALLAALVDIQLNQYDQAKPPLVAALASFQTLSPAAQKEHADRIVSVLDHLVVVCEKLGDTAGAADYRAQRDKLNQ